MGNSNYFEKSSPLQEIKTELTEKNSIKLYIKRDDLLHPFISGNKWRKLKYNILLIKDSDKRGIITFGGAFSNHLHAVAAAGKEFSIQTTGIVRGERPEKFSQTLLDCENWGMNLFFVERNEYKLKEKSSQIKNIINLNPDFFLIPEGGENLPAKKGCSEILSEIPFVPDYFCTPCGTGTTLAGLTSKGNPATKFLGFSVLKGAEESIVDNINSSLNLNTLVKFKLISDFHFGGYAKYTPALLKFIKDFEKEHSIPLDQVYTGKMFYGLFEMLRQNYFKKSSSIVVLHTGGLQGRLPELSQ